MNELMMSLLEKLFNAQISLNGNGEICVDNLHTCQTASDWLISLAAISNSNIFKCIRQHEKIKSKVSEIPFQQSNDNSCWVATVVMLKRYHRQYMYLNENTLLGQPSIPQKFRNMFNNNQPLPHHDIINWFDTTMDLQVISVSPNLFTLEYFANVLLENGFAIILMPEQISELDSDGLDNAMNQDEMNGVPQQIACGQKALKCDATHYIMFYGIDFFDGELWCHFVNTQGAKLDSIKWKTLIHWISHLYYYQRYSEPNTILPVIITEKPVCK